MIISTFAHTPPLSFSLSPPRKKTLLLPHPPEAAPLSFQPFLPILLYLRLLRKYILPAPAHGVPRGRQSCRGLYGREATFPLRIYEGGKSSGSLRNL